LDTSDETLFGDEEYYYDIGLGIKTDGSGNVIVGTGLDMASPGSELFGLGEDTNGIPNNIYNLFSEIKDKLMSGDISDMEKFSVKLEAMADRNMMKLVDVGEKNNFIDFLADRYETSEFNATKKQKSLEGIDSARAILEFNTQETAYNAALSMGSKILQYTLLDYLN
jgi:flagellar hook-associated protein 3 FlgL